MQLTRGGEISGDLLGWDAAQGQIWLRVDGRPFAVGSVLVTDVDAEPRAEASLSEGAAAAPPLYQPEAKPQVAHAWAPTWRSHAGVGLSFVLPGLGQLVQEREREAAVPFLATHLFLAGGGAFAMWSWVRQGNLSARAVGIGFFVGAGFNTILAAIHAHQQGRRWLPVGAGPGRLTAARAFRYETITVH